MQNNFLERLKFLKKVEEALPGVDIDLPPSHAALFFGKTFHSCQKCTSFGFEGSKT
jgi:hypothetical protein